METKLQISKLRFEYKGLDLRLVWCPGQSLSAGECQGLVETIRGLNVNASPFEYGFFAPDITEAETQSFMDHSIWCVIYRDGKPCGFAYNYDVGQHEGRHLIHLGLVKFYDRMGRDVVKAVYNALTFGNLANFGPHYGSNVSHVPLIIDLACHYIQNAFPHHARQDAQLRLDYLPVLKMLISHYMVPLLGYKAEAINTRNFTVPGALDMHTSGFESAWTDVPKSDEMLCNLFTKEWLTLKTETDGRLHIKDDLIQVGTIDYSVLGESRNASVFNVMKVLNPHEEMFVQRSLPKLKLSA